MRHRSSLAAVIILASCATAPQASTPTTTTEPDTTTTAEATSTTHALPGVLVFHRTTGFRHDSIPAGIDAITRLGEEREFTVTAGDDPTVFTAAGLSGQRVVVFLNTTGDVLDPAQQTALEEFIGDGNGFVGIHSATDTEYDWPWYGGLVGAYFADHPEVQEARVVFAGKHPVTAGLPAELTRVDEWYNFRSRPNPTVTVLATLDEPSYQGGTMGEPHPIVWAHEYEGGRAVYIGFGHTSETFTEPEMLTLLGNAITWTAGG